MTKKTVKQPSNRAIRTPLNDMESCPCICLPSDPDEYKGDCSGTGGECTKHVWREYGWPECKHFATGCKDCTNCDCPNNPSTCDTCESIICEYSPNVITGLPKDVRAWAEPKSENWQETPTDELAKLLTDLSAYKIKRNIVDVGEIEYVEWYTINKVIQNTISRLQRERK